MKTLKFLSVLVLLTGTMLISCKKEVNSPSTTSLGVKIQATNKSFSLLKSISLVTPSFVWDTSFIVVSKIEFEAEKSDNEMSHDSSEVHFEWVGPKKIDLFNLNSVIGNIGLLPGVYHEVSLKIKAFKADAGTSPIFYLSGKYANSAGTIIPIAVVVNEDFEFKAKKEGTMLDATSDYTSLINLNLTMLLAGIVSSDLNAATLTNGKIIISSMSNVSLYNKINTNVSTCVETGFEQGKVTDSVHENNSNGNGTDSGSGSDSGYNY